ncbi:type II secretion system F family protein [Archaeoglobus sp.]
MKLAYRLFGKSFKERKSEFAYFEKILKSARIPKPFDVYLAEAKFYSVIMGIIGAVLGAFLYLTIFHKLLSTITPSSHHYRIEIYHPPLPIPKILPDYIEVGGGIKLNLRVVSVSLSDVVIAVLFAGISFFIFYYITFTLFKMYPFMKAGDRKRNIDRMLPYAVNYMYALSKGGVGIIQIIRALSSHEDVYGEVAREFGYAVNLMDYFGYDFHSAMKELYDVTPSDTMKEFIAGLITTIDSGGDLTVFLATKCEQYSEKCKSEQKNFLETLGLLAESYVTIAVTAPLFILILQSIMLVIGSGNLRDLYGVIYLLIPATSAMFAFLVYFISPKEVKSVTVKREEDTEEERELLVEEGKEIYEKFIKAKAKKESLEKIKSPIKVVREKPPYILAVSLPISILYTFLLMSFVRLDILIITSVIIALLPLTIFHEAKKRRENIIKDQIPEILKGLASVTATGSTLMQAIEIVAKSGRGYLYDEIKRMKQSLDWGVSLVEAFRDLAESVKVSSLKRVVTILTDVITIGGDITETLHVCSRDAELERSLVRERKMNMFIYIIIIYVSFFTFIGIMYVLMTKLFPKFFEMSKTVSSVGFMKIKVDKGTLIWLLSQAMIFQALFSGLVAGIMGEEDPCSGAKHTIVMLGVVLIILMFLISR